MRISAPSPDPSVHPLDPDTKGHEVIKLRSITWSYRSVNYCICHDAIVKSGSEPGFVANPESKYLSCFFSWSWICRVFDMCANPCQHIFLYILIFSFDSLCLLCVESSIFGLTVIISFSFYITPETLRYQDVAKFFLLIDDRSIIWLPVLCRVSSVGTSCTLVYILLLLIC